MRNQRKLQIAAAAAMLKKACIQPTELEMSSLAGQNPLAGTVYTEGPKQPATCSVCNRSPARVNSAVAECSHCECPHRGRAWSDRPTAAQYFKGPWPKNTDADPVPADEFKA